jgi:excinuclease UvrABC nuclease subunit
MEKAKDLDFMQAAKLRDDIKITRTVDLITLFSKIFNKSAGIITLGAFSIFLELV